MANFQNPQTPISYTNKDFRAIIDELIDLTKKLTNKWDPSITNESDPAMVLLKLASIIGDKNNYNIDKNILEAFPETVTQDVSARSMYKQLGYDMPWYQSAKTIVSFSWVGRELELGESVTIPKYTMICNSDSSLVYTLLEDVVFNYESLNATATAIQGIIQDLTVNGDTTFTLTNIDSNNRIYFGTSTIAQNGVFITNVGSNTLWKEVSNLPVEPAGSMVYEFGVDLRTDNVYIEFPEDIETLIKNGLNIKYIITDGSNGNISSGELVNFYEDSSIELSGESLTLNKDIVQLYNSYGTSTDYDIGTLSGSDPESIKDAYKSWKRTVGTYDTLVTLRDYINAIYNSGIVSNDIVADRLTDIQSAYKIVTDRADYSNSIIKTAGTYVSADVEKYEPELNAYNLKVYMLQNAGSLQSIDEYERSFEPVRDDSPTKSQVLNYINDEKSIMHDFVDILPDVPFLFRNLYSLRIKIVPQYFLEEAQINEVKVNIVKDLWQIINSRKMEFGEQPDYYLIYDTIQNSDSRIQLAVLDDFVYTTYATYWDGNEFKHIPVSEFNDPYIMIKDTKEELESELLTLNAPGRFLFIDESDYIIYKYDEASKELVEYSKLMQKFRTDILARNILAGVTPLYQQYTTFDYTIDQQEEEVPDNNKVDRMTTYLEISPFGYEASPSVDEQGKPKVKGIPAEEAGESTAVYKLKDNETLQFLAPSFISDTSYSSYVMFEFVKNTTTGVDELVGASTNKYRHEDVNLQKTRATSWYDDRIVFGTDTLTYNYSGGYEAFKEAQPDKAANYIVLYYFNPTTPSAPAIEITKYIEGYNVTAETEDVCTLTLNGITKSIGEWFYQGKVELYYYKAVRRINANESYKLQPGDMITFFYKESSEEGDTPYTCVTYQGIEETKENKNVIIKPSFTLEGFAPSEALVKVTNIPTGVPKYEWKLYASSAGLYNVVKQFSGDRSLSGTKQIDIQKVNEQIFNPETRAYYFLTNNISEDKKYYQITFEYQSTEEGTAGRDIYDYILGPDEYFIYCDTKNALYEMLGYGSLIRLLKTKPTDGNSPKEITYKVSMVDYNAIAMGGLNAFLEHLLKPGDEGYIDTTVMVREQQIYNFTKGDEIQLIVNHRTYKEPQYPVFETGKWTVVKGFDIKYRTAGSTSAFEDLPKISISESSDENLWRGTAILNLDLSGEDAQVLDNTLPKGSKDSEDTNDGRQSIQQFTVNGVTYPSNSEIADKALLYVMSDVVTNKVGGDNIDVTYLNELGERKNIEILIYSLNPVFDTKPFSKFGSNIILNYKDYTAPVEVDIQLEEGYNYILGILNNSELATISIEGFIDGSYKSLRCLNNSDLANTKYGQGSWYFMLEGYGESNLPTKLKFSVEGTDAAGSALLEELVKVQPNNFFDNKKDKKDYHIQFDEIVKRMNELDTDPENSKVHLFKYNYVIDKDILIEDPLKAKSFFNENHICNPYTIAMGQMRMSDYNEHDSAIDIINNR